MGKSLAIGLAAGLIPAVVFASASTGPLPVRLLLFFLTPLPLYLAGFGLGWQATFAGLLSAGAFIALATHPVAALVYTVANSAPAVGLVYLSGLSRDVPPSAQSPAGLEWYPPGRLVAWCAAIGAGLGIIMMMSLSGERETLQAALKSAIGEMIKARGPDPAAPTDDASLTRLAHLILEILPSFVATMWMAAMLFNLWLAARITNASGRLNRPWPNLQGLSLPTGTPLVFAAALLLSLLEGTGGMAARAAAGTLLFAFVLVGLAVIHAVTNGSMWRPAYLWALYAGVLVIPGAPIAVALLGLVDVLRPMRPPTVPAGQPPGPDQD